MTIVSHINSNISASKMKNLFTMLDEFEPYYVIFIVLNGLVGNTISFMLFSFTKLKANPANILLAALAFADNWFLISLTLVTLKHFKLDLVDKFELTCKLTAYSTFVSSFLSVWFIAAFSIQRLIVVYFPFKKYDLCNKKKTCSIIIILVSFSLLFYSVTLVISGFDQQYGQQCVIKENWLNLFKIFNLIDTIQTMFIPFIIIAISNILIGIRLMTDARKLRGTTRSFRIALYPISPLVDLFNRSSKKKSKNSMNTQPATQSSGQSTTSNNVKPKKNKVVKRQYTLKEVKKHNSKSNRETTKILLIIASTFLILNFPIASTKTYSFFVFINSDDSQQLNQDESKKNVTIPFYNQTTPTNSNEEMNSAQKELIEKIASLVYYINFSINFFLYTFNTRQFREHVLKSFRTYNNNNNNNSR